MAEAKGLVSSYTATSILQNPMNKTHDYSQREQLVSFSFVFKVARFKDQNLISYTVTFSPSCVIPFYFTVAFLSIALGFAVVIGSSKITTTEKVRYDNLPDCNLPDEASEVECVFQVDIPQRMKAPIYFYYGVDNFHQNARKYVKSRSDRQLRGKTDLSEADVANCEPLLRERGNSGDFLSPCGLAANSMFNDTFKLFFDEEMSKEVKVTGSGIAWDTDRNIKFKDGPKSPYEDVPASDEDFIVWMRLSTFKNFDKLYFIIQEDLDEGSVIYVDSTVRFQVRGFEGKKAVFLTTTQWFGTRNHFLGITLLTVGIFSLLLASTFLFQNLRKPRRSPSENFDRIRTILARVQDASDREDAEP